MFVEAMSPDQRAAAQRVHQEMTRCALTEIFGMDKWAARDSVLDLWNTIDEATTARQAELVRDRLIHLDPVDVATDLADKAPEDLLAGGEFKDRLERFNAEQRPRLIERARDEFERAGHSHLLATG